MKSSSEHLHKQFYASIEEHKMLIGTKKILVAFSGGADSTALLLLLHELAKERSLPLAALHVNHMIRGDEADRDEAFCRSLCDSMMIPLYVERADIPALAKASGKGIEETARDFRYDTIRTLCTEQGYDTAALAHNADDNVETVLFNITRGSSLKGIRGIPPVRKDGSYRIIRPLITCEKRDICTALTELKQPWVEDSTNTDTAYTRNRIRNEIIPLLKEINPSLSDSIAALTGSARRDDAALTAIADMHTITEGRTALASLDDAILSRLLQREWSLQKTTGQLTSRHIEAMIDSLRGNAAHLCLSLPGEVIFSLDREETKLGKVFPINTSTASIPIETGLNKLPDGALIYAIPQYISAVFAKEINAAINIYKLAIQESLDSGKIRGAVYIRTRMDGDRIFCGGMHHKVKTLFSDRKLLLEGRRTYPILCDDEGILLIPGIACRDGVKADDMTKNALNIYYFAHRA
ncbi:MAG: tRNA lysidine(34) synthetase TilS [Clostridia bacterium]|nr:tRNA lysidine(34) synthetase TilS [Clostridia bacterium]